MVKAVILHFQAGSRKPRWYILTGYSISYMLLVPGWTPYAFRTAFIHHSTDSTRCWNHSSEIFYIMTQQHQTVAVLYWDLVTLESIAMFKRPVSNLNTVVMKRWAWSASQLVLRDWKCAMKISHTLLNQKPELLIEGNRNLNLLLSSLGEPVWTVVSVSCS